MAVMDSGEIPLLAMLRDRASYLSNRQKVIAENVANADTPKFAPHDLKPFSFQARSQAPGLAPAGVQAMTQPSHMQGSHARGPSGAKAVTIHDSETTLDGNSVVLEEEMMKMTDSRMNYDAAISFYQKSVDLLRMAIRKPGAG